MGRLFLALEVEEPARGSSKSLRPRRREPGRSAVPICVPCGKGPVSATLRTRSGKVEGGTVHLRAQASEGVFASGC